MRVLHIAKTQQVAGAENYLFELLPFLAERGYDVYFLNMYEAAKEKPSESYLQKIDQLRDTGVHVRIDIIRHKLDFFAIPRMRDHVSSIRPDIVHTHMPYADLFGAVAARWAGCEPVISSRHHDYSFSAKEFIRFRIYYGIAGLFQDAIIAVSNRVALLAQTYEGWQDGDTHIVHHGYRYESVDADSARIRLREEFSLPDDAFVIGTVARLVHLKGHRYAIDAMRRLVDWGYPAYWLFIGDGPERENLKAQAQGAGIGGRLSFLGYRNDVPCLLSAIDVMAHPTTGEAFGLVLIEAMAHGTPIVASRAGAIPEIVEDSVSGMLVPPRNSEMLAHAIRILIDNPKKRRQMSESGRMRHERDFTIDKMVHNTERVYRTLVESR